IYFSTVIGSRNECPWVVLAGRARSQPPANLPPGANRANDKRQTPNSAREFHSIFEASATGARATNALSTGLRRSRNPSTPAAARVSVMWSKRLSTRSLGFHNSPCHRAPLVVEFVFTRQVWKEKQWRWR